MLSWLIILMTYSLSMALRCILRFSKIEEAKRNTKIMLIVFLGINIAEAFFIMTIPIFFERNERTWAVTYDYVVTSTALLIVYAAVLAHMIRPLKKLSKSGKSYNT